MYLNFFGLRKEPFHITPDPDFLFLSSSHKEALASIVYGIQKRKGFIAIVGGVGVGKTTLIRSYLEGVDRKNLKIVYLFNANISFKDLLGVIFEELELEIDSDDIYKLLNKLHHALIEEFKLGNNVVLVIDEAQNMPTETLENLRMLSNLETTKEKLIQILLIGQPEFDALLDRHEMRQLKQRLAVRATITPLSAKDSLDYIHHRLLLASNQGGAPRIFALGALKEVVKNAGGIPRIINILCDNALVNGYGYHKKPVNRRIVRETIADFRGKTEVPYLRWAAVSASAIMLLSFAVFLYPTHSKLTSFSEHQSKTSSQLGILSTAEDEGNGIKKDIPSFKRKITRPLSQVSPKPDQIQFERTEEPGSEVRIVRDGDTIAKLTENVYGWVDEGLIAWVHQYNNHISDVNVIHVGTKVVFPKLAEDTGKKR